MRFREVPYESDRIGETKSGNRQRAPLESARLRPDEIAALRRERRLEDVERGIENVERNDVSTQSGTSTERREPLESARLRPDEIAMMRRQQEQQKRKQKGQEEDERRIQQIRTSIDNV